MKIEKTGRTSMRILSLGILFLSAASIPLSADDVPAKASIDPIPYVLHDKTVLAYEVFLGDETGDIAVTPQKFVVRDTDAAGAVLLELSGSSLSDCIKAPNAGCPYLTIFVWLNFDVGAVLPAKLWNEISFGESGNSTCEASVSSSTPPTILPPVSPGIWLACNGSSNMDHHHRRSTMQFNRSEYIGQRFAVDWIKLDKDGRPYKNDGTRNKDWFCYGTKLLAVAAGTVMDIKDGTPDNEPFKEPAVPITMANVAGNFVMLKLDNGLYVLYAHIIPRTLKVKVGQKVKPGQVLGKLGNSGNSTAPHLHFHLCVGPDMLFSQGVPYALSKYVYLGLMDPDLKPVWGEKKEITGQMPGLDDIVEFQKE